MNRIFQLFDLFYGLFTSPFFLVSLVFWLAVLVLVIVLGKLKKAHAISAFIPFLVIIRTKRLNKFLKRIAKISPRLWKIIFNVGIFVSFAFTIYGFYYFTTNLFVLLASLSNGTPPPSEAQITPIIPGLTINLDLFMYLIIPILFVVTVHEFAHAISASADDIPIKNTGVFGLGMFFIFGFGAFVEPDERAYRRNNYSGWVKARLAAAGSFSNAIIAVFALLITINFTTFVSPCWDRPNGLMVRGVLTPEEGGYNNDTLFVGDVILQLDGIPIPRNMTLHEFLTTQVVQNETIECLLLRDGQEINVTLRTGPPPDGYNQTIAFIGVQTEEWWPPRGWLGNLLGGTFPNTLMVEMFWLFVIALSVTIFNMMPLPIFDGDKLIYELLEGLFNKIGGPRREKRQFTEKHYIDQENVTLVEIDQTGVETIDKVLLKKPGRKKGEETEIRELHAYREFQPVDANGDGFLDHLTFELMDEPLPKEHLIEIQFTADVDKLKRMKKAIMNVIRLVTLGIIAGNFIISGLTIGFTLPFI